MGVIDWRDTKSLSNLNPGAAVIALGQILESLKHPKQATETMDNAADLHALAVSASPEAVQFADACNAMGRRMRAAGDCRPELRIRTEERKAEVLDAQPMTGEEDSCAYADSLKPFHRK